MTQHLRNALKAFQQMKMIADSPHIEEDVLKVIIQQKTMRQVNAIQIRMDVRMRQIYSPKMEKIAERYKLDCDLNEDHPLCNGVERTDGVNVCDEPDHPGYSFAMMKLIENLFF